MTAVCGEGRCEADRWVTWGSTEGAKKGRRRRLATASSAGELGYSGRDEKTADVTVTLLSFSGSEREAGKPRVINGEASEVTQPGLLEASREAHEPEH